MELNLRFKDVYDYVNIILNKDFKIPIRRYKRSQVENNSQNVITSDNESNSNSSPMQNRKSLSKLIFKFEDFLFTFFIKILDRSMIPNELHC